MKSGASLRSASTPLARPRAGQRTSALTLIELLAVISISAILFSMVATVVLPRAMENAKMAKSSGNLRQLGLATHLYLADHEDRFFPVRRDTPEGVIWFFGFEPAGGSRVEGERRLDRTRSPLYPYIRQVGGIEICPGFDYNNPLWKPKFKGGASWGYGYNVLLGPILRGDGAAIHPGRSFHELSSPSRVLMFGTSAQVNTFQAPASPTNPMLEEFYLIDDTFRTIHFRFGGGHKALFVFADGNVGALPPYPGEMDRRLPAARVGRITPRGSRKFLQ